MRKALKIVLAVAAVITAAQGIEAARERSR